MLVPLVQDVQLLERQLATCNGINRALAAEDARALRVLPMLRQEACQRPALCTFNLQLTLRHGWRASNAGWRASSQGRSPGRQLGAWE